MYSFLVVGIILLGKCSGETPNDEDRSNTDILTVIKIIQGDIAKLVTHVQLLDGRINDQQNTIIKNQQLIQAIVDNSKEARRNQTEEIHYIKEKLGKLDQRSKDVVEIEKILRGEPRYVYVHEKATWPDAEEHCQRLGGHLATITSQLSNSHLFNDANQRFGVGWFWIGYNDIKSEGKFEWVDPAGASNTFTDWCPGDPNGGRNENCVYIENGVRGWLDYSCQYKAPYVCQLNLRCNGVDTGCCTSETPCEIGDGDCDSDTDCKGELRCGTDNCAWVGDDDCCFK